MKVLVIQHKKIGDVLLSTILCDNLKKIMPNATIDYLINIETVPVVSNNPNIDNIITLHPEHRSGIWRFIRFALQIRRAQYDVIIDPFSKLESWLIVLLSAAKRRISYKKKYRSFLYTDKLSRESVPESKPGRIIDLKLLLLQPLQPPFFIPTQKPRLYLSSVQQQQATQFFHKHRLVSKPTLMVNIVGSCPLKTYPPTYMATLINWIAKATNIHILFNFSPAQKPIVQGIYDLCHDTAKDKIRLDLSSYDLSFYIAIMSKCDAIVGNEGGGIHIAKALNKPSFTIFSPWITKQEWSTFEDGIHHVAIHPSEFDEDFYKKTSHQLLKDNTPALYEQFKPKLIWPKLNQFMAHHFRCNAD